jgi:tetratricopeptide (TPR) repeat protein
MGEVLYMFGDFPGAEKNFRQANQVNPGLSQGRDLIKAAFAHLMTGDVSGAEKQFQATNAPKPWWQFLLGHRQQAIAAAEEASLSVVAIWKLQTGILNTPLATQQNPLASGVALLLSGQAAQAVEPLKTAYALTQPSAASDARALLAIAYQEAGQNQEAKPLVAMYPLPPDPTDPFSTLVFPRILAVRATLLGSDHDRQLYDQLKGDLPDRY